MSQVNYKSNFDYHLRQYKLPYRSTLSLIEYLKKNIDTDSIKNVIDLGCGGGANIHWLKKAFPHWQMTGVDFDPEAVRVASESNSDSKFLCEDILNIGKIFKASSFDLALSIQVVVTAPFDIYTFLDVALPLTKKDMVITSLFSEEYFEQETIRRDLSKGTTYVYKIDSLKRLRDYVDKDQIEISWEETKIDTDLPKPEPLTLSTYTIKTADGERLQVSPYMLMPWYTVYLKKG